MIQELLGGAALIGGERKIPINGTTLDGTLSPSPSPSPLLSPSSSTTTNTNSNTNISTSSNSENLKCPRCDSSNTKFCYYNNYNLTQPRHFCKTCRRYWTKGGALRNVPIGGGCRKNKNTSLSTSVGKSSTNKMKTIASEIGRSGFGTGFDHELPSNPIMWATPQNSHLLALLRAAQNPNPSFVAMKEEGSLSGSHLVSETTASTGAMNMKTLSLDPLSQVVPSIGLCSSFWKTSQQQAQQYQGNNFTVAEDQNSGLQELYQRLRLSTNYGTDGSAVVLSNLPTTSSSSNILEFSPNGGEFGYWNPAFSSWSDFPTPNGAYP